VSSERRHIVVVGGGITGLAAALRLSEVASGGVVPRITVLEAGPRFGGKLASGTVDTDNGPRRIELGADAFLARVPAALDLAKRVGLAADLVHPETGQAYIYVNGSLRPMPAQTVLGVPSRPELLADAGLITAEQAGRMSAERDAPGELLVADRSVGSVVRERLGDAVVDNLVEPLLGGVYAGDVNRLSLRATIPALAAQLQKHPSLLRAAGELRPGGPTGPVFASVRGGMGRLAARVVAALQAPGADGEPRADLRSNAEVRGLARVAGAWQLALVDGDRLTADGVLLATPAGAAARLLRTEFPTAATELAEIPYADVALVNLLLPDGDFPSGSGLLVPNSSGLAVKAMTFVDQKWGSNDQSARLLRVSIGRYPDSSRLNGTDSELIAVVMSDLAVILGPMGEPTRAVVHRWRGGLPQYLVGHVEQVARTRELLAGVGIAIAGAAYDGVGIAGCVGSADRAAAELEAFANVTS
jgi:oxygen-dependent protoporphyrinogen oxidase